VSALIERAQLEEAIRAVKGHQTAAAKRLGLTPAQLAHYLTAEGLMNLCRELRAASRAAALADHDAQRASAAAVAAAVAAKRSAAVSKEQLKDALVVERGCVGKVAERLGVLPGSVYKWVRKHDLLDLQTTLVKEAAAARHVATVAKRKQYDRDRERQRVRNRPVEQVPNRLVGQILPQSVPTDAPELTVQPAPRAPAPAPYQRPPKPWDGVIKRCAPDPRIAARSFNLDDSDRVPPKPKKWSGRRVR